MGGDPDGPPARVGAAALALRWLALVAALAFLHLCGRGPLARPSLSELLARRAGAPLHPPIETAIAAIRLLALGAGGYLLIIVTVALVGRLLGHRPTLTLAARLTPPSLRATVALATAVGVTAVGSAAGAAQTGGPGRAVLPPSAPTLRWVAPAPTAATVTPTAAPTLRWVAPAAGPRPEVRAGGTAPAAARGVARPPAHPEPKATGGVAGPTRYVIRPGDSFWSIAANRVGDEGAGGAATDERVARYWLRLVRANRAGLPVPGQPDLLFPGDRIVLPPLS